MITLTRALLLGSLLAAGCLTHMPPAAHTHMQIHWAADWDSAAAEAARSGRPILACLVAGQIDGAC
jgi:hypothetical protein